jgi:hypothetical protein
MSDLFATVASIDYPIIDADAHVYEPPGVWRERVAARLRTRAPKVVRTDEGDVWLFDDGERVRPVGLMAAAGVWSRQLSCKAAERLAAIPVRRRCFNSASRLVVGKLRTRLIEETGDRALEAWAHSCLGALELALERRQDLASPRNALRTSLDKAVVELGNQRLKGMLQGFRESFYS